MTAAKPRLAAKKTADKTSKTASPKKITHSKKLKPRIIETPESANALVVDPDDEVGQRAVALARARTSNKRKPATRGKSSPRRTAVERLDDPPPASGLVLVERVSRAVERELAQIEVIVGGHHVLPRQRTEAERRARTLASLAKTLGEVTRLRTQEQKVKPADDDMPRDLDEFRRALHQRLEQMVRSREISADRGDEPE